MTHPPITPPKRVTLTVVEAASYLGLAVSTLNKWRVYGGGPRFMRLGRAIRYRQSELDAFLSEQTVGAGSQH
ncbi:MAG: helix-turn-helix domain-containing protein [Pseudomonadota bacterium]